MQTITCPVCERKGLLSGAATCPQCDADLTCFQALDALAAQGAVVAVHNKIGEKQQDLHQDIPQKHYPSAGVRGMGLGLIFILLLCLGLAVLSWDMRNKLVLLETRLAAPGTDIRARGQDSRGKAEKTETDMLLPAMQTMLARYFDDLRGVEEKLNDSLTGIERINIRLQTMENNNKDSVEDRVKDPIEDHIVAAVPVSTDSKVKNSAFKTAPETFLYQVQEADTLWAVAERLYGHGKYYPVIMEQNPGLVISGMGAAKEIRLFADQNNVEQIYQQRVQWRGEYALWRHEVQPGETSASIMIRFQSVYDEARVFWDSEPEIEVGKDVIVILR